MSMHSQARTDAGRARSGTSSSTDWAALEQQLCRTKTILQEILEHLQGVLRNLRAARAGFKNHSRTGARSEKPGAKPGFRATRTASAGFGARPQDQKTGRPRPGFTRFDRTTAGPGETFGQASGRSQDFRADQTRPGESDTGRTSGGFRTGAAFGGAQARDASRPGNPYRTFTGGPSASAGPRPEAKAGAGNAAGGTQAGPFGQTRSEAQGARSGPFTQSSRFSQSQQAGHFSQSGQSGQAGQSAQSGPSGPYGRTTSGQSRQRETFGQTQRHSQARASHSSNAYDTRRETGRPEASSRHRFSGERQERGRQAARHSGMNLKNAYDILCLDYPCTPVEIKDAYRGMARMFHPDLGGDEEVMKDVNLAYELAMRFCAGPRRAGTAWTV